MDWLIASPLALWLAIGGVFLSAEVASGSGWLLWPAGAAALTAVVAASMPLSLAVQTGLFALLTILTTLAGRRFFPRRSRRADINDTPARLAGSEGVVVQGFQGGAGRVLVDGKEWAALLEGENNPPPGSRIVVTHVGGAQLMVRPL